MRHIGNFYGHRSPVPLFRALNLIIDSAPQALADVRIELVGHLSWRFRKHPSLRALPADLVKLVGTVPYSELLRLMSSSDLLLTIDAPDHLSAFLPSKLIEYLGSGALFSGSSLRGPRLPCSPVAGRLQLTRETPPT